MANQSSPCTFRNSETIDTLFYCLYAAFLSFGMNSTAMITVVGGEVRAMFFLRVTMEQ
jgi:hypothetical protein